MFEKFRKVVSKLVYAVSATVFLTFVFYFATMTYTGAVQKTVENTKWSFNSFVGLSNQFEKVLQNGVYKKYGFINLNGRIAKYLGFNTLNHRQKLANGFLHIFENERNINDFAVNVVKLNKFLSERGIVFLYVLAPSKGSFYDAKFAPGYSSSAWKSIDNMTKILKPAGVNVIDMNAWFEENGWRMEDVFFRTDHHWLPQAGLVAARRTMELLEQRGVAEYDEEKLQEDNYEVKVYKNWYLGSDGKRTGKYYAGVDDISAYLPKFSTDYKYAGLPNGKTIWTYKNNILSLDYVRRKNYFTEDPNCMYLFGSEDSDIVTNSLAHNTKRVLIVGDSYRRVWEYFLATQFQRIYYIDLRGYEDGSLAQRIEEIKPDIVLMCTSGYTFYDKRLYKFGIEEYDLALAETNPDDPKILLGDFEIPAQDRNNNNFVVAGTNIRAGQTYSLTMDSVEILKGRSRHIQITLIDQTTTKPIANHYFEAGKAGKQKWVFTVPKKPNNYGLYLYAGTKGYTTNNSVKVTNVLLQKGIQEDSRVNTVQYQD